MGSLRLSRARHHTLHTTFLMHMLAALQPYALLEPPRCPIHSAWKLSLNIGREDGAQMPEQWGVSGARLPLSLDVCFEALDRPSSEHEEESVLVPFPQEEQLHFRLRPLTPAKFISMRGEEHVPVKAMGAANIAPVPYATTSGMHTVRWWLDFEAVAEKQDVELPCGRIFFFTRGWDAALVEAQAREFTRLEEELVSLQARDATCDEEIPSGANDYMQAYRLMNEKRQLRNDLWACKVALSSLRSKLPGGEIDRELSTSMTTARRPESPMPPLGGCNGALGTVRGDGDLAIMLQGTVAIKRRRRASFGWLKVPLPVPRLVYETIGTFSMRTL